MNVPISVLLYAACPTGQHVGSVVGTLYSSGRKVVEYPLRYECGCVDPRRGGDRTQTEPIVTPERQGGATRPEV